MTELKTISTDITRLLLQNYEKFLAYLIRRVGNREDAEDILQQTVLKALRQPPGRLEEKSVLSWFYTIFRNALTDNFRQKVKQGKHSEGSIESAKDPEQLRVEVCECLHSLLPAMNKDYRELIRRIDLEDEDPATVAKQIHISRNALDVKLHRARRAMKKALEQMCGACTQHACLDCSCKKNRSPNRPQSISSPSEV